MTPPIADLLFSWGIHVITLGDHVWDQKELIPRLAEDPRILRPANLPTECPGRGWAITATPAGPVTVINLLGRVFLPPIAACPFRTADTILHDLPPEHGPILVDLHAEATSEKAALARYLDGRVSAVIGTHTHVPTADEQILPGGTAFLSDVGMVGPADSIIGRDTASVLARFLTGMPQRFKVGHGRTVLDAVIVDVEPSGRATHIQRIREWHHESAVAHQPR